MVKECYRSYSLLRKWRRDRSSRDNAQLLEKNKHCKIAVVLHMFYENSWKEIREYLLNLEGYQYDLYVTVTIGQLSESTLDKIRNFHPNTTIIPCENRGFDLAPFLTALKQINLDQYDILIKLQSKSTKRRWIYIYNQLLLRRDWFVNLYEGVLGAQEVHQTIDKLLNDPQIGLVAAQNLIVSDPKHKQQLIHKMAADRNLEFPENYRFVAGTCFGVKAACLKEIQDMNITPEAFVPTPASRGLSFGHFMERYLCVSVEKQGYSFYGNDVCKGRRALLSPMRKLMYRLSSERLHEEDLIFDPEWFFWQMDNRLILWKYKNVALKKLKYARDYRERKFTECPPYRYLKGDVEGYKRYCEEHEKLGWPQMSIERFNALRESIRINGYDEKHIIVYTIRHVIIDGQHRACCLCDEFGEDAKFKMLKVRFVEPKSLIWSLTPLPVIRLYHKLKGR